MSINEKRTELIKTILDDDIESTQEDEILHILLLEQLSKDPILENDKILTSGQKAADKLAKFAGSWFFIIIFLLMIVIWIAINSVMLTKPYDVYPFILLNLILSCVAAIQAPVIMMSQNRQEQKDRIRAVNDYK
ncbi:MAG TPA: DUF1003 domain-containing protein, partial [Clostridia bacterium]|nr:DUF1003 domain-containing protein [Clostridia bacterium]